MYKMMIVDDEPLIRQGLRNLIEWEVYGIEIVGESEDGMKAYLDIKEKQPNIALIDISMPNLNGIELIKLCSHLEQPPKFIILSGFNDFEYVRTAMQYGAINYLLKPVDLEELTNTLISTIRLLDDATNRKQQFQESITALRNDVLVRLLNNRIESRELREKCRLVDLSFHCNCMYTGILKPVFPNQDAALSWQDFSHILFCEQFCGTECACYGAFDTNDNLVLILKDYSHVLSPESCQILLDSCGKALGKRIHTPILSAVGDCAVSASELSESYRKCLEVVDKRQILGDFLVSGSMEQLAHTPPPSIDYTALYLLLANNDKKGIEQFIHAYLSEILVKGQNVTVEEMKYRLIEFVICTMQELKSSQLPDSDLEIQKQNAYQMIRISSSFPELKKNMLLFLTSLSEQLTGNCNTEYSFMVQNALDYVQNNYQDCNLALKTLAQQLDVNATYLGRQFALETKEYFSDYLNRIRIAHAIRLLNNTTWKTAKIAESVGFANISYFFTIFKKNTGKRPSDFRS